MPTQIDLMSEPELLDWMKKYGSTILVSWDEDQDCWECAWVNNGQRYTGVSKHRKAAMLFAVQQVLWKEEAVR